MELDQVMRTTAATREFTDEPVSDAVLYEVLDRARFAPSGGNRQPWGVVVVRDPDQRRRLRDLVRPGWQEYAAHLDAGLVPFAPGADGVWTGPAVDLAAARTVPRPAPFVDNLDTVPALLVVTARLGDLAVMDNGLGRQSIVGGASVYPFVQNIALSARNAGLGTAITTFICREEPAVTDLLGLPPGVAVASLVAMGHPQKVITRLRRKPVEEFATIDRADGRPLPAP